MPKASTLYDKTFFLAFTYNFLMALNFSNNAIYPLYVKQMGGTAETVGAFMGAASVAALVARPLIGVMIDRLGIKRVLLLGSLGMTLPSIGYWALLDLGLGLPVWGLRLVHGFGFGAHLSAFFTLAAQQAPEDRRNESVAMYGLSGLAANLVGPFLGEQIYDAYGLPAFFALVTGFGFAGTITIAVTPVRKVVPPGPLPTLGRALKLVTDRTLMLSFVLAFAIAIFYSSGQFFLAPLARERMIADFGLYFTGYALAGIVVRVLARKLGDRYGVRRVMIPGFLSYATGMLLVALSDSTEALLVAGLFSGGAHAVVFPAVHSLGFGLAPVEARGSVMALLTGMTDVGGVFAAFAFGQAAEYMGYGIVFPMAATVGYVATAVILINVLRNPTPITTKGGVKS